MTYWTLDQAQITADLQAMVRINSVNPGLAADGAGGPCDMIPHPKAPRWMHP